MRLAGTLIVQASQEIREQSRALAASALEVSVEDLVYDAGAWSAAGTDRRVTLFDLAPLEAEAKFTGRIPAHPTGCAVCEVEIDPETGLVCISRYTAVDDAGQPINPLILHGQVAGGIAQGIGQALLEHLAYEPGSAQLLTASFLDYAIPRATTVPDYQLELTEDPTAGNPLRVKGGGEAGITPCLAAVANAVVDAVSHLGVTHLPMPLTSSQVWSAISSH